MATVGVRVTVDGELYDVDLYSITAVEWRTIKRHTGMRAAEFMRCLLGDFDADVIAGLVWVGRARLRPGAAWDDNLPVLQLLESLELVDEDEEDADPKASDGTPLDSSKPDDDSSSSEPSGTSGT